MHKMETFSLIYLSCQDTCTVTTVDTSTIIKAWLLTVPEMFILSRISVGTIKEEGSTDSKASNLARSLAEISPTLKGEISKS